MAEKTKRKKLNKYQVQAVNGGVGHIGVGLALRCFGSDEDENDHGEEDTAPAFGFLSMFMSM